MKKFSKRNLALAIAAMLLSAASFADTLRDYPSLDIYRGARAAALAGAYTAIADDSSAVSWNMAGLAYITAANFSLSYNKWIDDSNLEYLAAVIPAWMGAFGADISYVYLGTFESRGSRGELGLEQIKAYTITGTLGYGLAINNWLSAGAGFKALSQSLDRTSAAAFLIDAGLMYKPADFLTLGFALKNFNPSGQAADLDAGGAFRWSADILKAILALDVRYSDFYGASYSAGLEAGLYDVFYLRTGCDLKKENEELGFPAGLAAGMGIKLGEMNLDYSYNSRGSLGATHLFTLNFIYSGGERGKESGSLDLMRKMLAEIYFSKGQELYEDARYESAVERWQAVKDILPVYPGIDEKIAGAKVEMEKKERLAEIDRVFSDGMDLYNDGRYKEALEYFVKVEKLKKDYEGIRTWITDAKKMELNNGKATPQERCFNEGMKYYNQCQYREAMDKWNECAVAGYPDERLRIYRKKSQESSDRINKKIAEAETLLAAKKLVDGIIKVRDVISLCPVNKYAKDTLVEYRAEIQKEGERLFLEGIDDYSSKKIVESIIAWEKALEIDPEGKNAGKARENIKKAREKLKNVDTLKGK